MKYILMFLFVFVVSSSAFADDFKTRYNLPKTPWTETGKSYTFDTPHKCLDTSQWKIVLLMGNDYHGLYDWRLEIKGVLSTYDKLEADYLRLEKNYQLALTTLEGDRKYYNARLSEVKSHAKSDTLRLKIEKYILYAVILAETVLIVYQGVNSYKTQR